MQPQLAQQEGIFVGITAGATFAGALQVVPGRPEGLYDPLHAARHRGALSQHPAFRGYSGGDDAGGDRDLAIDPECAPGRLTRFRVRRPRRLR